MNEPDFLDYLNALGALPDFSAAMSSTTNFGKTGSTKTHTQFPHVKPLPEQ
jgi:hypothetical protein